MNYTVGLQEIQLLLTSKTFKAWIALPEMKIFLLFVRVAKHGLSIIPIIYYTYILDHFILLINFNELLRY